MWAFMDQDDTNFVKSNSEGTDRVMKDNGKYAFLMESTSVEFIVERRCELTKVGGLLDTKGYGIALPPSKKSTKRWEGEPGLYFILNYCNIIRSCRFDA